LQEINLGYESGADRLILRFPQLVSCAVGPDSPLAPWSSPRSLPSYAAEIVVVVEGIMFYNSSSVMRTVTYKLPQDLRQNHSFVPMVSRGEAPTAVPVVNWQVFHEVVAAGKEWVPRAQKPGEAASAKAESTGTGGGNLGMNAALGGTPVPVPVRTPEPGPTSVEVEMASK
jgi:Inward rectifier potassium channel C-terminal domain